MFAKSRFSYIMLSTYMFAERETLFVNVMSVEIFWWVQRPKTCCRHPMAKQGATGHGHEGHDHAHDRGGGPCGLLSMRIDLLNFEHIKEEGIYPVDNLAQF